jgi:hypothetical protein
MAEYYPLLAKAIAGLPNSTPETRRAVYERARKALLGQLQNLQPPVPAADLARETESLDAAVARLEAELSGVAPPAPQPPAPQPPAQPPSAARPPAGQPPVRPPLRPMTPPSRPVPPRPQTPPAASQAPAPPAGSRRANGVPALDEPAGETNDRAQQKIEPAPPPPSFDAPSEPPPLRQQGREPRLDVPPGREPGKEPRPEPPRMRLSEPVRPIAPQQDLGDAPIGRRLWIVIGVVVVLVALVAVAAWKLRDRPDQLTAFNRPQNQTTTDTNSTKNTQRVGDADSQSAAPAPAASAAPEVQPAPAPANPAPAPAVAAAPKPADSNAALPVAYRAALLVEAPDEPNKVKTYVGTVVWKLENVSNGPGQPLSTAVHADIDIPDDKLKVTVDIQKNTDPTLSASHTITVVFTPGAGSTTGGVKEISAPQLRSEDSPSGDALKGVVVPIMDNSFLVGLTRGDAEDANIDLLKKLEWIDIPIMLNNGRIAKLTFEKNASGSRAINDAFTSWQGQ